MLGDHPLASSPVAASPKNTSYIRLIATEAIDTISATVRAVFDYSKERAASFFLMFNS